MYSWGPGMLGYRVFTMGEAMVLGAIILATPTPSFRSLGLDAIRHVVHFERSAHSRLVR
jgi:hypothetical protein